MLFRASYVVSFAFPQSTTKTISFIVILASAMLVARTTFRTLGGGFSKINLCEYHNKNIDVNGNEIYGAHKMLMDMNNN